MVESGVGICGAIINVFHINPFGVQPFVELSFLYFLAACFLPLCFIWIKPRKETTGRGVPWYDVLLFFLGLAVPLYFMSHWREISGQGWAVQAPPIPVVMAVIFWILAIEAARRVAGTAFCIIVSLFSVYPLFAGAMPGILWTESFQLQKAAAFHVFSLDSLMGTPMRVMGSLMFGYMLFAVVLQRLGGGKLFDDIAVATVGKTRGGSAKVSIIASCLFGTISGSAVANVLVDGGFTIPAMKRDGLPGHFAAAVEATASSGGAIMPPVMGSVAFIMAEMIQVPYPQICIAAAVPALLYYLCIFAQIDSYSARIGLKPKPVVGPTPSVWRSCLNNFHLIISFISLIAMLFVMRWSAWAPWIAAAVAVVLGMFRKETRLGPAGFLAFLEEAGKILAELLGMLMPVGMIIGSFVLTGLAFNFPHFIVTLAGGNVYFLLLLGAAASFVLGMGVSMAGVYIFLAIVLCPALVSAGLNLIAVHLFVMYTALFSYITPPVALAAFAAAPIAGADPMQTGFTAMRLGVAKYILPFAFTLCPALILHGPLSEMLTAIPSATIGLIIISGALEGYFWGMGQPRMVFRVLLFGAGLAMLVPGLTPKVCGLVGSVVIFGLFYVLRAAQSPRLGMVVRQ